VHQLVNKNFDSIKMHGRYVRKKNHVISLSVTCINEDSVSFPSQLLQKYIANEFLHNVWPLLHFLLTEVANKAFIILNGHYLSWFWWVIAEQLQQAWNYYAVFLLSPSSAYYVHEEGREIVPQCPWRNDTGSLLFSLISAFRFFSLLLALAPYVFFLQLAFVLVIFLFITYPLAPNIL
jgi:hypothetical protein